MPFDKIQHEYDDTYKVFLLKTCNLNRMEHLAINFNIIQEIKEQEYHEETIR